MDREFTEVEIARIKGILLDIRILHFELLAIGLSSDRDMGAIHEALQSLLAWAHEAGLEQEKKDER